MFPGSLSQKLSLEVASGNILPVCHADFLPLFGRPKQCHILQRLERIAELAPYAGQHHGTYHAQLSNIGFVPVQMLPTCAVAQTLEASEDNNICVICLGQARLPPMFCYTFGMYKHSA